MYAFPLPTRGRTLWGMRSVYLFYLGREWRAQNPLFVVFSFIIRQANHMTTLAFLFLGCALDMEFWELRVREVSGCYFTQGA